MKKLATLNNKKMSILKNIDEDEYSLISRDLSIISKFEEGFMIYKAVTDGYKDYNQMIELFLRGKADNRYISDNAGRFISNYLTGVKSFLDRWPTYLSRNFPSDLLEDYKNETHEKYDLNFAYRLIDQLRNYVQHCGTPPIVVKAYLENEKPKLNIFLDCNTFVERFKKLKPIVKNELKTMESQIELTPYMLKMNDCLINIHNKILNKIIDKNLIKACYNILDFTLKFKNYKGDLAIIENKGNEDTKTTLNVIPIRLNIVKLILKNL